MVQERSRSAAVPRALAWALALAARLAAAVAPLITDCP